MSYATCIICTCDVARKRNFIDEESVRSLLRYSRCDNRSETKNVADHSNQDESRSRNLTFRESPRLALAKETSNLTARNFEDTRKWRIFTSVKKQHRNVKSLRRISSSITCRYTCPRKKPWQPRRLVDGVVGHGWKRAAKRSVVVVFIADGERRKRGQRGRLKYRKKVFTRRRNYSWVVSGGLALFERNRVRVFRPKISRVRCSGTRGERERERERERFRLDAARC